MALRRDQYALAVIIKRIALRGDDDNRIVTSLACSYIASMHENTPEDRGDFIRLCDMHTEFADSPRILITSAGKVIAELPTPYSNTVFNPNPTQAIEHAKRKWRINEVREAAARVHASFNGFIDPVGGAALQDLKYKRPLIYKRPLNYGTQTATTPPVLDALRPADPAPVGATESQDFPARTNMQTTSGEFLDWYEADRERRQKPSES